MERNKAIVSIILVNYNTLQITLDCINSIFEITRDVDFEVILVDNASTDGSKEQFEQDKRILYIYNDENLGFGRANNLGLKFCSGKYIFCLNTDTILINNAVKLFYNKMETISQNVVCLGTMLLDYEGKISKSYGRIPSLKYLFTNSLHLTNYKAINYLSNIENNNFFEVDYIWGADLFLRTSAIEKYGFFDEDFFLNFEEAELQARYRKYGFKNYIYSEPQIMHLEGMSKGGLESKYFMFKHLLKIFNLKKNSMRLYYKKTKSRSQYYCGYLPYVILSQFKDGIKIIFKLIAC